MNCPSCFKEGHESFCPSCRKALFGGAKVSHILPFDSPSDATNQKFQNNTRRLSISGVQLKYSLKLVGDKLKLADAGGQYILKPIPLANFTALDQAPANEHLCMQLAKQVFKLETPPNALVQFKDGSPAYLVKRFDVLKDGLKRGQEDFAALAKKTPDGKGDYKYEYSYEGIADLMKQYLPAYAVEIEKLFRLVVFNYIIGNGDAHLKNFSVSETSMGDYKLSPVYDVLCTKLHINDDRDMALDLFKDDFETESFKANAFARKVDFVELGKRIRMKPERIEKELQFMKNKLPDALQLIEQGSLNEQLKERLKTHVEEYASKRIFCG